MLHIDLSSKRAQLALRFFTYGVMTIATAVLTFLAIFYAMGYRFNQNQLSFEQGGLMQFRSVPEGATVVLDGKEQSFKTPGRSNVTAGQHTVEMRLNGYHIWRKTVDVSAGQLLWLNYARFVPLSVTTTSLKKFDVLHTALASPDRHWFLLHQKPDAPTFIITDVTDQQKPQFTALTLPDSALTRRDGKLGTLLATEWDQGSRYFLVQHQNGDLREYLRVDRTKPEDTVNLSRLFQLNIVDAHFGGSNANIIMSRTDDVLRRLDIGAGSASAALLTGVSTFTVNADGAIAYAASRPMLPDGLRIQVGIFKDNKDAIVRDYAPGTPIKIDYASYFDHTYLALNTGDSKVHILLDPTAASRDIAEFASFDLGHVPDKVEFSDSGRMLLAAHGGYAGVYDLELHKVSLITTSATDGAPLPRWLDDFYLITDAGGSLRLFEFDGQNDHELTTVVPGYGVLLGNDGKMLLSVARDEFTKELVLQSSQLVLK